MLGRLTSEPLHRGLYVENFLVLHKLVPGSLVAWQIVVRNIEMGAGIFTHNVILDLEYCAGCDGILPPRTISQSRMSTWRNLDAVLHDLNENLVWKWQRKLHLAVCRVVVLILWTLWISSQAR